MAVKLFPQLSDSQTKELVEKLQQWALGNGLVMYPPNFESFSANVAPVTLYPTPFPAKSFQNAMDVQTTFNALYANVASKHKKWLLEVIEPLSKFDSEFTGKLFETYKKAVSLGIKQHLSLGLFRSDYMVHDINDSDNPEIKQIEFNTVSVSFAGLSTKVGQLHNYLNKTGAYDENYSYEYYENAELPISDSLFKMAEGVSIANSAYRDQQKCNSKTVILFIVQEGERNVFDQRHIEFQLIDKHSIKSYRSTLEEVEAFTTVRDDRLYIKETMDEVSVVYYRSGYAPSDYESDPDLTWGARLYLENTASIKCPSLLTQLSGCKKVQQLLTSEKNITRILPDISDEIKSKLISTFVSIYPLDESDEGQKAKKLALETPSSFVLKPQREGGGNNIYKHNIPDFLQSLSEDEKGAYILMELIHPPNHKNKIIRNNEIFSEEIISELGIFGTILFNEESGEVISNENAGYLLRSKFSSSDEGGVAAGFGCVDNVYLY